MLLSCIGRRGRESSGKTKKKFTDVVCDGKEADDIAHELRFRPVSKGLCLFGVDLPGAILDGEPKHGDTDLAPSTFCKFELHVSFGCFLKEELNMDDMFVNDLIVAVSFLGRGGDKDVVHKYAKELFAIGASKLAESRVHEGLKDSRSLLRAHVQNLWSEDSSSGDRL